MIVDCVAGIRGEPLLHQEAVGEASGSGFSIYPYGLDVVRLSCYLSTHYFLRMTL